MTDPFPEHLLRELAPQVLGAVVRRYGHFDLAEDAVQEALIAAAMQWPRDGVPREPRSWLIAVAARRLTDALRSEDARRRRELRQAELAAPGDWSSPGPEEPRHGDDSLTVFFLCCHPDLTTPSQIALTLRAVGGLSTREIARAFLVSEDTMTRRITRAKQLVARAGGRFTLAGDPDLEARVAVVLRVLYLVFTEGYAATTGPSLDRPELAADAIRLTRMVRELLPHVPEVSGLLALMLLTESRRTARAGPDGLPVLLQDQDRERWDADLVAEGISLIEDTLPRGPVGPYQLQAAIAAVHAEASTWEGTDWAQIVALYDLLLRVDENPVVRLNRAVAVAMDEGPQAGLALVDALADDDRLTSGHRWHGVRGQLLERLGRGAEAAEAYRTAATLTPSLPHVRFFTGRARQVSGS